MHYSIPLGTSRCIKDIASQILSTGIWKIVSSRRDRVYFQTTDTGFLRGMLPVRLSIFMDLSNNVLTLHFYPPIHWIITYILFSFYFVYALLSSVAPVIVCNIMLLSALALHIVIQIWLPYVSLKRKAVEVTQASRSIIASPKQCGDFQFASASLTRSVCPELAG